MSGRALNSCITATTTSPFTNSTEESPALSGPAEPSEKANSVRGKGKEDSQPIPAFSLPNSPINSSPAISPSPSITTNTFVPSETSASVFTADKNTHDKYQVEERAYNDTIIPKMDPNVGTKSIGTTTVTASTSASAPSTPASSSSTSIPLSTPLNSSTPSTSPSTTNVNDLNADVSGLTSLLRARPQIYQNLNVKFAPLPELAPRKRKSSTPLGLAARSQLARRRRMMYRDSYDDDDMYEDSYRPRRFDPPEISEKEEIEAIDDPQETNTKKKKSKKTKEGGVEKKEREKREGEQSEDEDPLAALAKKMGRAGKHLWKKMSAGGKAEKSSACDNGKKLGMESVSATTKVEEEHQGVENGQESVRLEEVGEQCSEIQRASTNGSVEVGPSLREASSIPLPPSEPQSPIDVNSPISQEALETEMINGGDSKLDGEFNCLPTTPAIFVSAA